MKNFYRKTRHIDYGTKSQHCVEEYGPLLCKRCDVEVTEIGRKPESCSDQPTGYDRMNYNWDIVTLQCPDCEIVETYETTHVESCGSYHGAEERRVYGG